MFESCHPTGSKTVPHGPEWLHEVKYDGYRLRLERDGGRVRLRDGQIGMAHSPRRQVRNNTAGNAGLKCANLAVNDLSIVGDRSP
jgi:hypothetical protein